MQEIMQFYLIVELFKFSLFTLDIYKMEIVSINKSINLSEHFSLGEVTKSSHTEIYNIPSHVAIENLKRVCIWLEVLRGRMGPIIINSGYRSPELNKKVGGAPTSNHLTGCAVDIHVAGIEQAMRYAVILMDYADETKQDYDELLIERNKGGGYWLHFAVRPKDNRRKTMFLQK